MSEKSRFNMFSDAFLLVQKSRANSAPTSFTLTATTVGAETLTLQALTVAATKTVRVDWGDGAYNDYTDAGTRTHAYAGAGTYAVKMSPPADIKVLDLQDTKLSGPINAANPMPANLTTLALYTLSGVTWQIDNTYRWPVGATTATILACNNITVTQWTDNAIRSVQWESSCNQAKVDAILTAFLANKANFTWATPTLDLLGGGNAVPSGTYQAADPVTSGNETKFALVNGNGSYSAGPEWTVSTL